MTLKSAKIVSLIALVACVGLSLWARGQLPDTPIATHYDLNGNVNGYMPRDQALLFGPGLIAVLGVAMLWVVPAAMPRSAPLERSQQAYGVYAGAGILFTAFIHAVLVLTALGYPFNIFKAVSFAVGLLLMVIGNYLPKTRYNYVLGFRNPWTLSDERVWDRTHRLAGPLYMLTGLGIFANAVLAPQAYQIVIMVPVILAVVAVCHGYSYWVARQLKLA